DRFCCAGGWARNKEFGRRRWWRYRANASGEKHACRAETKRRHVVERGDQDGGMGSRSGRIERHIRAALAVRGERQIPIGNRIATRISAGGKERVQVELVRAECEIGDMAGRRRQKSKHKDVCASTSGERRILSCIQHIAGRATGERLTGR